jgi:hypothetical protein
LLELVPESSAKESALMLSERGGARFGVRGAVGLEDVDSGDLDAGGLEGLVWAHAATLQATSKIKSKLRIR